MKAESEKSSPMKRTTKKNKKETGDSSSEADRLRCFLFHMVFTWILFFLNAALIRFLYIYEITEKRRN